MSLKDISMKGHVEELKERMRLLRELTRGIYLIFTNKKIINNCRGGQKGKY